ncbi:MAG: prephenate dehydratase domain-containing protein [Pseudomonadota bacterium]|nr:prephenate dehydratase domain-containing protein [Pseudomonadota bacterium]
MKIAYQGVKGAYGYIASVQCFGDSAQIESCTSFQSVFDRVIDGKANFGVIPLENSTAGRVADVHLLLKNKPLFIVVNIFCPYATV